VQQDPEMMPAVFWKLKLDALVSLQNACPGFLMSSRNPGSLLSCWCSDVVCRTHTRCWGV